MTSRIPMLAVGFSIAVAVLLDWNLARQGKRMPRIFLYLAFILPFAAGGFHTYTAMITTLVLVSDLILTFKKKQHLRFFWNGNTAAAALVTLGYCLSPLWAADKGMAVYGIVRYLPLFLLALVLMQYSAQERERCLELIPLSGAVMTMLSCVLLPLEGMDTYLTVNGRLSAFFQYPNTYAAFLLAGIILVNTKPARSILDIPVNALLILGVVLSGSRTGFLLLVSTLIGIVLIRKKWKLLISLGGALGVGLILATAATNMGLLHNADRFTSIGQNSGSFLVRLLYYKDALPVILGNPFGIGYLGYRATECTFQTGRYTVSFVHNGLLQLLLDIGWVPALAIAAILLREMLSPKIVPKKKLLLLVVLAHCMLDFDLQFFAIWVILLTSLNFEEGRPWILRKKQPIVTAVGAFLIAICLWLGTGDLLYSVGATDLALAVTPFHTDALTVRLRNSNDAQELDNLADKILHLCPTNSLAYSAKANAALSRGQVQKMMEYKEQAIACAPYSLEEYCDYFEKLYTVMGMYLQAGDSSSAAYCAQTLLALPERMETVSQKTDPLAYLTGDDNSLILPEEYMQILTMVSVNSSSI